MEVTKYILHGGNIRTSTDGGTKFFQEIIAGHGQHPKILWCFFAQPKEKWDDKFKEFTSRFDRALPDVKATHISATHEHFLAQVAEADAVILYGGDSRLLADALGVYPHLEGTFRGKTIAGSSAGAIVLSTKSWDCDVRRVVDGLGLVPYYTMVHYDSNTYGADDPRGPIDWQQAEADMKAAIPKAKKITILPEGKFVIIKE